MQLRRNRFATLTVYTDCCTRRMYATAAARSDGLLLVCGGRDVAGTPLDDAYGFARHRDGTWESYSAPKPMASGRYQHAAIFVGSRLHVTGGAVGGGKMVRSKNSRLRVATAITSPRVIQAFAVFFPSYRSRLLWWIRAQLCSAHQGLLCWNDVRLIHSSSHLMAGCLVPETLTRRFELVLRLPPQVDEHTSTITLDTTAGVWCTPPPLSQGEDDHTRRCRHAVAAVGPYVFLFGGLKGSQLLEDFLVADDSGGTDLSVCDVTAETWIQYYTAVHGHKLAVRMLSHTHHPGEAGQAG